eukprot:GHVH01002361.1.p1 GENE.GHVH01002361.1~~GHVH01002361.1.p1  ORF type:complete len:208 (-),score=21.91 GHVH01002361.1:413-1036(-)
MNFTRIIFLRVINSERVLPIRPMAQLPASLPLSQNLNDNLPYVVPEALKLSRPEETRTITVDLGWSNATYRWMYRAAILYLALVSMVALINQHRLSFALLPVHASLHSLSLLVALAFFHSSSGLVFLPDWLCLSFFICSSLVASHSLSQGWITGRMKDWLYSFSNAFLLSSLMVAILSCLPGGWPKPGIDVRYIGGLRRDSDDLEYS